MTFLREQDVYRDNIEGLTLPALVHIMNISWLRNYGELDLDDRLLPLRTTFNTRNSQDFAKRFSSGATYPILSHANSRFMVYKPDIYGGSMKKI